MAQYLLIREACTVNNLNFRTPPYGGVRKFKCANPKVRGNDTTKTTQNIKRYNNSKVGKRCREADNVWLL